MDFEYSEEEKQFRQTLDDFFEKEKDLAEGTKIEWNSGMGYGPASWEMLKKIGQNGWLCPTWPKEYGGLSLSYMYRYIIQEKMHHYLNIYSTVGAGMAGPVILNHGSEEQKEFFLPKIAKGEVEFALGYTEPEAGSDLASLDINVKDEGDHFIINGQKMFNTRAHYAQYHWLGSRTQKTTPKYKGISLFIIDLKTSGISLTPYYTVGGERTNGVFYDNVNVPKSALVGELNRGFYYILEALAYERISTVAGVERDFSEILEYARKTGKGKDPLIRQKLAESAIDIEAARLLALKVASMLDAGTIPSHEASMLKIMVSESEQKLINTAMQIMGPYGQLRTGSKWAQLDGEVERVYRDSLEELIIRGTSEIMRNVIAERGLKLPRS
ncbi:MAG: acyl-CoA dehydrogenase family protein [Deltaproteobacteria bacterium]|nr:acyl-CoA dehydrogenase family protein [Deltaproteobacteria bacterium]